MDSTDWLARNRQKLGSPYEELFVRNVLSKVPDLDFGSVSAQMEFRDADGRTRYCDFTISEGGALRIAIEVDGYDKRGTGQGMSKADFVDWQRRHAALVSRGWQVIRFPNTDVRDHPERCIEHLQLLLRHERTKEQRARTLAGSLRQAREELVKLTSRIGEERAGYGEDEKAGLLERISSLEAQLRAASHTRALTEEEQDRLDQFQSLQRDVGHLREETSTMKTTVWALSLLVALVLILGFLTLNNLAFRDAARISASPAEATAPATSDAITASTPGHRGDSCENPLSWRDARTAIGQSVAISGPVVSVVTRNDVNGQPTWIEIGAAFPSRNRFTAVVWGDKRPEFEDVTTSGLEGKVVCVLGDVTEYKGNPRAVLRTRGQLQIQNP